MRIAFLSAAGSVHTRRWVCALHERGHTVALCSLPGHRTQDGAYPAGVSVKYLKRGGNAGYFLGARELREFLEGFKPDILNAHYATGYGTLARKCGFKPLLLSVWGSDVYEFPSLGLFHRKILQKNLGAATCVASTSRRMARQVERFYDGKKQIFITPFGVDTEVFRRRGQPPLDSLTVGIVKTLEPKYGVEYLIRAFAQLKSRLEDENRLPSKGLNLVICGGGALLEKLKALSRSLGVSGQAQFLGPVPHDEVPGVLSGLDIFCAPSVSDSESFGVAAVEAMACEVPVVTSDADGFREVVLDGVTGFVVERKNVSAIAEKLYLLSQDAALRRRLGSAGREHVTENYAWDKCVDIMEAALMGTVRLYKGKGPAGAEEANQ
jgi:glycosyltransferase involved in cell wall biosynthesis